MSLTVAIQMDPIEHVKIDADSTFALALEAQARGHALLYYGPHQLFFCDGTVSATVRPLKVRAVAGDHFTLGEASVVDLSRADVVLLRQDPPFDLAYITTTHLLERLGPKTLVSNDPAEVRNAPEKLLVTAFNELMPPTLIASDPAQIRAFREGTQGHRAQAALRQWRRRRLPPEADDENLGSLLEMYASFYREPIMVQRYLPEVRQGDKRIILDRRRVRRHDQPHSGRRRGPLQHACRRQNRWRPNPRRATRRDLRRHRP